VGHNKLLFHDEMHNNVARMLLNFGLNSLVPSSIKTMNIMLWLSAGPGRRKEMRCTVDSVLCWSQISKPAVIGPGLPRAVRTLAHRQNSVARYRIC